MKYISPIYFPNPDYYKYAKKVEDIRPIRHDLSDKELEEIKSIVAKYSPKIIFNIGAQVGRIEYEICRILYPKEISFRIYSIDPWLGQWDGVELYDNRFSADNHFNTFLFNIKKHKYENYVIPCRHTPLTWYRKLKDSGEKADFIFLNMLRFSSEEDKQIMNHYVNILNSDGILAFKYNPEKHIKPFIELFKDKEKLKILQDGEICFLKK